MQNEVWAEIWRRNYRIVEDHMYEFNQMAIHDPRTAAKRHFSWLEDQIEKTGKSYPFSNEVEAFAAFTSKTYKTDSPESKATALNVCKEVGAAYKQVKT